MKEEEHETQNPLILYFLSRFSGTRCFHRKTRALWRTRAWDNTSPLLSRQQFNSSNNNLISKHIIKFPHLVKQSLTLGILSSSQYDHKWKILFFFNGKHEMRKNFCIWNVMNYCASLSWNKKSKTRKDWNRRRIIALYINSLEKCKLGLWISLHSLHKAYCNLCISEEFNCIPFPCKKIGNCRQDHYSIK